VLSGNVRINHRSERGGWFGSVRTEVTGGLDTAYDPDKTQKASHYKDTAAASLSAIERVINLWVMRTE
jgi:hypothetical protein